MGSPDGVYGKDFHQCHVLVLITLWNLRLIKIFASHISSLSFSCRTANAYTIHRSYSSPFFPLTYFPIQITDFETTLWFASFTLKQESVLKCNTEDRHEGGNCGPSCVHYEVKHHLPASCQQSAVRSKRLLK